MEYHTVYQYLECIRQQRTRFEELAPAAKWQIHAPAVMHGVRRIRTLVCSIREAKYLLVHRLVKELKIELEIIEERLSSCTD